MKRSIRSLLVLLVPLVLVACNSSITAPSADDTGPSTSDTWMGSGN